MDAAKLNQIFEKLDQALEHPTELLIRGGAAVLAHGPEETLILPTPAPDRGYNTVFRVRLTVRTPPAADLDPEDISDVDFLINRFRLTEVDLIESFERLPARFKADPVVQDNLRFVIKDYL